MRPSAGSIAMPGPRMPCANVGSGTLLERHDRARSGRCDGDAGITAEQIFQFTKHFAHNLFD